jgi:hypothetical protein
MKYFLSRIAIALLLTSLASVTAFAKVKKEKVTFPTNMKVNGTVVKKGTYDLKFDDKTGELTIVKDGKVIARANASVEKREKKAQQLVLRSVGKGDDNQLTRVTFSGADHDLVISGSQASR